MHYPNSFLTEKTSLACLRQQAERLNIPGYSRMRKEELLKKIKEKLSQPCGLGIEIKIQGVIHETR